MFVRQVRLSVIFVRDVNRQSKQKSLISNELTFADDMWYPIGMKKRMCEVIKTNDLCPCAWASEEIGKQGKRIRKYCVDEPVEVNCHNTWENFKLKLLKNKDIKKEYDALTPKYEKIHNALNTAIKTGGR
jgi:hypothetical protein